MDDLRRTNPAGTLLIMTGMVLAFALAGVRAADRTWTGSTNGDGFWTNAANWGGTAPAISDALFFAGTNGLLSTNNFANTNSYSGLTFNARSGPFTLTGTGIALTGGITDQNALPQTNNLDLQVGNLAVSVTNAGTLILNSVVASTAGSLTKVGALELWRDYNGLACIEQRIEELKHDLAADGFCLQPFFATESAFLAVLFTFNLLSLYQHQTTPAPYRQPGTLRVAVFLCGAVLGVMGRGLMVKLSASWGGLRKHKPLMEATLDWLKCASPKLIPPEDRLSFGGTMI